MAVDFFAVDFFAVDFFAVVFFAVLFSVVFFAVDFFAVDFFAVNLFAVDFLAGSSAVLGGGGVAAFAFAGRTSCSITTPSETTTVMWLVRLPTR